MPESIVKPADRLAVSLSLIPDHPPVGGFVVPEPVMSVRALHDVTAREWADREENAVRFAEHLVREFFRRLREKDQGQIVAPKSNFS